MKKLLLSIFAGLFLLVSCASTQPIKVAEPCNRKVWFNMEVHDLACFGENYFEDGIRWRNVGEVKNPDRPILVIFWDNTNDCVADIANVYGFHKTTDIDNPIGLNIYTLKGPVDVEVILSQIERAGDMDIVKWLDCEPHSSKN